MRIHEFDVELTSQAVQVLRDGDSVTAFFQGLGYDTSARILQTATNLGLSEPLRKRVKRVELIADENRLFQVYLIELQSVTVADIKAIGRAFRDKAGNFLFVLTDDYEDVQFVLLDRTGPPTNATAISAASPSLSLRRFSVDRRHPSPVRLRVLRRFTWTEADPFGQFDKLRFAYDLAYWSEAFFNNRGLFSDYYLCERLPARDGRLIEFSEWREDPKPTYVRLRQIYDQAAEKFAGKKTNDLCALLYEPVLRELGFTARRERSSDGTIDLRLFEPGSESTLGMCLPYAWGRELDRKDEMHDSETPEVTPTFAVVDLLSRPEVPWVVLTNGKVWRLYSQRAHSRATNYYEVDLDEVLGRQGFQQDIQDAFRYFWLLFRMQAFRPVEQQWQGKLQSISMLDRLLLGSEEYAKQLGENLKTRVFTQVFPVLAEGFLDGIRQRGSSRISETDLDSVFQGTLTLLYRLLFLLYAEARDLLPIHSREYREASLQHMKQEIRDKAGNIAESNVDGPGAAQERKSRIEVEYSRTEFGLWKRLKTLFGVIDRGSEELNVPRYNGGLFLAQREMDDHSPEAAAARFLERERVPDRYLALALDLLARDVDSRSNALVFIDYKSLGVRQLGSIYEGVLEFRLKIASEKLAIVKEKGREVYQPYSELSSRDKQRADAQNAVVARGRAYLENDKRERKATGSYYTPDHIVKYIVGNAVGPVLEAKLEALRPRLREAQVQRREFFKQQEEFAKRGMRTKPREQADLIGRDLVEELFDIKVLDPAMGSGHFLVEAVDFITDKILEFLNAFPWNPVLVYLERMRMEIEAEMDEQNIEIDANRLTDVNLLKRHVLKRCVYGVDLNPMAVELTKVSLWLDCFTLGAPLSFLDHHLRWGNSLIGSTMARVNAVREANIQMTLTGTSEWQGLTQAVQTMIDVGGMPDITPAQVASSKKQFESALSGVDIFKRILDLDTSRWFVQVERPKSRSKRSIDIFDEMLQSGELFAWTHGRLDSPLAHTAMARDARYAVLQSAEVSKARKFFHWELEFPEVFYAKRHANGGGVERVEESGFDAVIGNPPWVGTKQIEATSRLYFWGTRRDLLIEEMDLYELFLDSVSHIIRAGGYVGYVLPNTWYTNRAFENLRKLTIFGALCPTTLVDFPYRFFPFPDVNKETCVLILIRNQQIESFRFLQIIKEQLTRTPVIDDRFFIRMREVRQILKNPGAMLFVSETDLTRMLDQSGTRLGDFIEAHKGWMSIPQETQTSLATYHQELFSRRELEDDPGLKRTCRPCARGEDTQHYYFVGNLDRDAEMYVNATGIDDETAKWQFRKKVICQRITGQNSRRLIAAYDDSGRYVAHPSTNLLFFKTQQPDRSLRRLTALLNADCLNEYYRSLFGEANTNITADVLHYLPAPPDFFTGASPAHLELDGLLESLERKAASGRVGQSMLETDEARRISDLIQTMFNSQLKVGG